jgi:hypothetical protein
VRSTLTPYLPGYNPIEEAFSEGKAFVRKVGARNREPLVGAIGEALSAGSVHDPRSFLEHAGYRSLGQLV